ncbi:MAG TPA: hypothetical protein VKY57_08080 [Chitinispirillaceae bacterium]|nr:hypothetical protein [Chitinispirillaceae bacterium]
MHSFRTKSSASSSFVKSIILTVILIIAILIFSIVRSDLPSQLYSMVSDDTKNYQNITEYSEEEKSALKNKFAGFWVYRTKDTLAPVQKWDHLEILDNGIIWQIRSITVIFPWGDSSTTYSIRTAFIDPFGKIPKMQRIACNARVIRQVFIHNNDTCYGASQVDELWEADYSEDLFFLNQREYIPYKGEVSTFFPEGMIDLVDLIELEGCNSGASLSYYIKREIQKNSEKFKSGGIYYEQLIKDYYAPALIDEIFQSGSTFKPSMDSLLVRFAISPRGAISNPKTVGKIISHNKFEDLFFDELRTWVFPQYDDNETNKQIEYLFYF